MTDRFRWIIIGILFLISMTNYIDRASISYVIPHVSQEFHFNNVENGYILGAFGIGYMLTIFLVGMLVDKYGSHKILTLACFLWMLATLSIGFAQGLIAFFLARVFLGVAESPNFVCMTKSTKEWLLIEERNLAFSLGLLSVPIAMAFSGPVVTMMISLFNWRIMYFILAGLTLIFIPLWWILYRDNPKESPYISVNELALIKHSKASKKQTKDVKFSLVSLIRNKTLLANNWGYFVFGFYLFFYMNWLPSFFKYNFHCQITTIGWFTVIPWVTAAFMMIFMGWISDYIFKKTGSFRYSRTYPLIFSHLIGSMALIPLLYSQQIVWILLSLSLSLGAIMSVNAVYYSVNIDIAHEKAATSFGLMSLLFSFSGIFAPIVTGWIVHLTSSFHSVFLMMVILSLSASLVLWFFHNK